LIYAWISIHLDEKNMYLNQIFTNLLLDERHIHEERVFTNFSVYLTRKALWICHHPQAHIVTGK
jgi:hypothetical protein